MELLRQLPAFLIAVLVISAVPGPAIALLIRRCSVGGFRAGVPIVLGLETGLYFWIIAAGAGLAALYNFLNVAQVFYPNVPAWGRFVDVGGMAVTPPWTAIKPMVCRLVYVTDIMSVRGL